MFTRTMPYTQYYTTHYLVIMVKMLHELAVYIKEQYRGVIDYILSSAV